MGKKGSKFLALFMVFALIVTYSFSVSILSVYADDEQGDANAKAAASEEAAPTTPEPAATAATTEPSTPAPADNEGQGTLSDNDTGTNDGDGTGTDDVTSDDPAGEDGSGDSDLDQGEVITDPAATDEEEVIVEEEEEEYPEVTLHASAGGVSVTLHAPEGALPEGAKLSVSQVNSAAVFGAVEQRVETEDVEMVDAIGIDVTPLNKDGKAIQPKKSVTVTFSGTGLEAGDIDVFRVSDSGSSVTQMGTSIASPNKQQFSTNHFTIYVVSSTATMPVGDGSSIEKAYTLEFGEAVEIGSDDTTTGWSITYGRNHITSDGMEITNNNQTSSVQYCVIKHDYKENHHTYHENFYIKLMPKKVHYAFNLKDAGESEFAVVKSDDIYKGQKVTPPSYQNKEVNGKNYEFQGWYTNEACTKPANFNNPITEDANFYAKYIAIEKIVFKKNTSDAANIPAPIEAREGTRVTLGMATRDGYTFAGWNTAADGNGTPYGGNIAMPENGLVLYAQWYDGQYNNVKIYYHNGYNSNVTEQTVSKNSRVNLLSTIPDRGAEWVFDGWTSMGGAVYYPGGTYEVGFSDVHLTAKWSKVNEDVKNVTLTARGKHETYNGHHYTIRGVEGDDQHTKYLGFIKVGTHQSTHGNNYDIYADIHDITATGKNAGTYSTPLTAQLYKEKNHHLEMLPGYSVKITNNLLIIDPVKLTVSTDGAKTTIDKMPEGGLTAGGKVTFKDGEASKEAAITYEGGAVTLVNHELLNLRTVGVQDETGKCKNNYEIDWGKPDEWGTVKSTAKKYNYVFTDDGNIGDLIVEDEPAPKPTPVPTPITPDQGDGDGGGNGAAAVAFAIDDTLVADVDDNDTPAAAAITDNATPKSAPAGTCAVLNLASAILTALLSLIMLISYFGKRREENPETGEVTDVRSGNSVKLASIIPAIGAIAAFIATENMADQMVPADKWTVMMVAILAVQAGVAVYAKLKDTFVLEDVE